MTSIEDCDISNTDSCMKTNETTSLKLKQLYELKERVTTALLSLADIVDQLNASIRELEKKQISDKQYQ